RLAVAAARHAAGDLAAGPHRLRAERDRPRILEHEAREPPRWLGTARDQRLPPDELALVELDREAEPGVIGRLVRRHVRAPDPVALLQAQRVDRPIAAGHEPVREPGPPELVPEPEAELRRAVELPA